MSSGCPTRSETNQAVQPQKLGMEGSYMYYVAKIKALSSCVGTVQLICAFVFAYAKSRISHFIILLLALACKGGADWRTD